MKVCIGGTFNVFHKGHQLLVSTAVKHAGENGYVFIGIASGELVHDKPQLRPLKDRKRDVETFLETLNQKPVIEIEPITDKYGPTLDEDFDVIIVSPETKETAVNINQLRQDKGLPLLTIIEIPFVLANDGRPIQSSRIIKGEINSNGTLCHSSSNQN